MANKILVGHMKFYNKHYIQSGSTAIARCIESTALRINDGGSVPADMEKTFRRESKYALVREIAERTRLKESSEFSHTSENHISKAHEQILRELLEDDGEDEDLARQFLEESEMGFSPFDGAKDNRSSIIDAYVVESSGAIHPEDEGGVGPLPTSYESKIRRASLALQKTIAEELAVSMDDGSDSDLCASGSDPDTIDGDSSCLDK